MDKQVTKVSQWFTNLKVYDSETQDLEEHKLIGKLSTSQCKTYIAENYPKDSALVVKTYFKETFNVNSVALYQLKIDLTNGE